MAAMIVCKILVDSWLRRVCCASKWLGGRGVLANLDPLLLGFLLVAAVLRVMQDGMASVVVTADGVEPSSVKLAGFLDLLLAVARLAACVH